MPLVHFSSSAVVVYSSAQGHFQSNCSAMLGRACIATILAQAVITATWWPDSTMHPRLECMHSYYSMSDEQKGISCSPRVQGLQHRLSQCIARSSWQLHAWLAAIDGMLMLGCSDTTSGAGMASAQWGAEALCGSAAGFCRNPGRRLLRVMCYLSSGMPRAAPDSCMALATYSHPRICWLDLLPLSSSSTFMSHLLCKDKSYTWHVVLFLAGFLHLRVPMSVKAEQAVHGCFHESNQWYYIGPAISQTSLGQQSDPVTQQR